MRMLFIADTIPFPPRNGLECVTAYLLSAFAACYNVDLLIINDEARRKQDFISRRGNVPKHLTVFKIEAQKRSLVQRLFDEVIGVRPAYFTLPSSSIDLVNLFKEGSYDCVWVGDVSCLGLIDILRDMQLIDHTKIAVGINESASVIYWESFKDMLRGRSNITLANILRGIRSPIIKHHEQRYLQQTDLIHVQTGVEKKRVINILRNATRLPIIVDAPNGADLRFASIDYDHTQNTVLLLENLSGARSKGARWFLKNVWPDVVMKNPEAQLLVAGYPPSRNDGFWRNLPPNTTMLGFVEDLVDFYSKGSVAVVTTTRGTGIINRVLDSLAAGLPIVASPEALSTIPNFRIGEHGISCNTKQDFVHAILNLLSNADLSRDYSKKGRTLALSHPTWTQSADKIIYAMNTLTDSH